MLQSKIDQGGIDPEIAGESFQGNPTFIKDRRIADEYGELERIWQATQEIGCHMQVYLRKGATLLDAYNKASSQVMHNYPDFQERQRERSTVLLIHNWNQGRDLSRALVAGERDAQQKTSNGAAYPLPELNN